MFQASVIRNFVVTGNMYIYIFTLDYNTDIYICVYIYIYDNIILKYCFIIKPFLKVSKIAVLKRSQQLVTIRTISEANWSWWTLLPIQLGKLHHRTETLGHWDSTLLLYYLGTLSNDIYIIGFISMLRLILARHHLHHVTCAYLPQIKPLVT